MIFQKPRPIYWEWLFFGKNSPLSFFIPIFDVFCDAGPNYFQSRSRDGCGLQRIVQRDFCVQQSGHSTTTSIALACSWAIATFSEFAICTETMSSKQKPTSRLSDAEVVLSRLLLPHETLLLPFKEVGPDLCGASSILDLANVSPEQIEIVLRGVLRRFSLLQLESFPDAPDI